MTGMGWAAVAQPAKLTGRFRPEADVGNVVLYAWKLPFAVSRAMGRWYPFRQSRRRFQGGTATVAKRALLRSAK
jgi:hypothetical protein